MSVHERNDETALHDAQDRLINSAASGRPSLCALRFSKAAMLEGSLSIVDPRLWPLHGAALSFALLVVAAAVGGSKPGQQGASRDMLAVVCSPEEQCNIADSIDGGSVATGTAPHIAQAGRRMPMIAPGDQFSISPPPPAATQTSDARPMIDYTLPANL